MPKRNYQKKADVSCVIFSLLRITVILLGVLIWMASAVPAGAKVRVSTFSELSKELKGKEKKTIVIEDDIIVTKTLTSQGTKILTSNGCSIKRSTSDGKAFYGSLIKVVGGSLSLRGVSLQGGGAVAKGKLYGYLVDLAGGQLSLRDGTVLKNNKNSSKATDGGGAVRVRSGGTLVLNGGKITNNSSVAGGAAIRVDRGGSFYMKSGTISDNICVGRSRVSGFEGRGGAICNYGTTIIDSGTISENKVKAYTVSGKNYGGVGGGIANFGVCRVRGGNILQNTATVSGGGIYAYSGSLTVNGARIRNNTSVDGDDIGLKGGSLTIDGSVGIGEIWVYKGKKILLGDNFSPSGSIKILPSSIKNGVKIAEGNGVKKKGKKLVLGGAATTKKNYALIIEGKVLKIKKKNKTQPTSKPTSKPTSTHINPIPTATSPSFTYKPIKYRPVATLDPNSIIETAAPKINTRSFTPTNTPYSPSPATYSPAPVTYSPAPATYSPAPATYSPIYTSTPSPARRTTHPPSPTASVLQTSTHTPVISSDGWSTYRFSSSDIKKLKESTDLFSYFDNKNYNTFLKLIEIYKTEVAR